MGLTQGQPMHRLASELQLGHLLEEMNWTFSAKLKQKSLWQVVSLLWNLS